MLVCRPENAKINEHTYHGFACWENINIIRIMMLPVNRTNRQNHHDISRQKLLCAISSPIYYVSLENYVSSFKTRARN